MNNRNLTRGALLLLSGMLLFCGGAHPALAEEDGQEGAEPGTGAYLITSNIADLGAIPAETESEQTCDALMVVDLTTGVLLHEKNITAPMPVEDQMLQLMSATVALDYFSPDDVITVTPELLADIPSAKKKFQLRENSQVLVSDLIASMLLCGHIDSSAVLSRAVQQRAGSESLGALMSQKARALGMTGTDYAAFDGMGTEAILTTAEDQCLLYLATLHNEVIAPIIESGVYEVRSKSMFAAALAAGEETGEEIEDYNRSLPEKLENTLPAAVPTEKDYDVRLSDALTCFAKYAQKSYGVAFFRATEYRSELAILYWSQEEMRKIATKTLSDLTEIFSRRKVVNLAPYVQAAVNKLTIEKSGVTVSGWSIDEGYTLYGRQMNGYNPDDPKKQTTAFDLSKMVVQLQPNNNSMMTSEDGSRTVRAIVMIDNSVADTITLFTAPKTVKTDGASGTGDVEIFSDDDVMPEEPTLMSQYGWLILICGAAFLAMVVIVVGVLIRNRMER